jgi:hypothetical protein
MWSPGATLVAVGEEAKDQPEQSVKPAPGVLPTVSQDATVNERAYFSAQAILAATRSARLADDIESDHPGDWGDPHVSEHLQAVTSAIVYSATFLEALVNEWYTDAAEPNAGGGDGIGRSRGLEARTVDLMAGWRQRTGRQHVPPLLKYQFLLLFADRSQLDEAEEPYQSADLVVKLRNRIIHFEPHTITMDPGGRLIGALASHVEPNRMLPQPQLYWPYGILSSSCARWALDSVLALASTVCERIEIEPYFWRILRQDD